MTKFARATGDIHSLSAANVRLIALAHSLHVARYGSASLRSEPQPARAIGKGSKTGGRIPGWGEHGGTWEAMDAMNEAALAAQEGTQGLPIIQ